MNFQENLFGSIPWPHGCNWDNLKCGCVVKVTQVFLQCSMDIWAAAIREVLVCSTVPTNVGKLFT